MQLIGFFQTMKMDQNFLSIDFDFWSEIRFIDGQYAFYVLATPKLRQADASPRQETFSILANLTPT